MLTIRHVVPEDSAAWLMMRADMWPEGAEEEHAEEIAAFFRGELEEPVAVLLALNEAGEPVGLAELSLPTEVPGCEGKRTGYVEGLYVLERNRGSRVAMALLRAAEEWSREQKCVAFASDRAGRTFVNKKYRL
jgi:aminoglycoside 6'-N-acetyltransferase I